MTHTPLAVIGGGPAGIAAGLVAKDRGLAFMVVEQGEFGGAMRHYPRQKVVMTQPLRFRGHPVIQVHTIRKEALIDLFEGVVRASGLSIQIHERVESVRPSEEGFVVRTAKRELACQRVLLAVGRRGTPRKLGVPGEDLEKVAYRLIDPELFRHQHVLVVGGGDSAVEAAIALSEQPGNQVTLCYRSATIDRPKAANRSRLEAAQAEGAVAVLLESEVRQISLDRVTVEQSGRSMVLPNDFVFIFAGGVLPTAFLREAGIRIQTHHGPRVVE